MRARFTRAFTLLLAVIFAGPVLGQGVPPSQPPGVWPPVGTPIQPAPQGMAPSPYAQLGNQPYFPPADASQMPPAFPQAAPSAATGALASDFRAPRRDGPSVGLVLFDDVDSWRGVGDRGNIFNRPSNNDGGSFGFNFATRLGAFTDMTSLSFQFGASYGLYDLSGRPFNFGTLTTTQAQQQVFVTTGFFKRANDDSSWSFGLVHDWMLNQAWGAFAVNPTLGQWRGQIAYAVDSSNEFGLWGSLRDKGDTNLDFFGNSVVTRPISQGNLFWHHKWALGADGWVWIGLPENDRLNQFAGGSLGDFIIGSSMTAPLNDYVSLYANTQYMHPSASPGSIASGDASWYIAVGVQYTVGGGALAKNVGGNSWLPLMPVANNGNFLVDSVRTF